MDQTARRRRRNLIQNIAIALLSVSAVLLFAQLQLYNLGTSEDPLYLERLTGEGSPSRLREFPAPVRVVLTDSYGRYGSLGFTTNSDGFSALGLREALGSVQHLAPSATDAFRGALSGPSIYFDFLNPLPLQVLAELTGAEGTALEGNARCLLLAAGADGSVHLYVWDGADTVLTGTVASTALSIDSLTEAVSQSGMGSVSFAFEVVEMEPLYGKLFPLSILPTELPQLPVLSAASSISGTDWLLAAFGFNINTRERYAEADGTEVITEVEADRSLHIRPSGEITYRSGTDATLEISAQEEVPTAAEAVLGASILLEQLTEDRSGEARLYLESVSQGTPPSFCSDIRSMVSPFASPTADTPPRSRSPAPASPASPCGSGSTAPPGRRRSCCRCGRRWPLQRSIPAQSCLWAMPTAAETRYPPAGWRTECSGYKPLRRWKGGPTDGELPSEKHHHSDPGSDESLPPGPAGSTADHRLFRPGRGPSADGAAVRGGGCLSG